MSRILRAFLSFVSVLFLTAGVFAQSQSTTGLIQGTVVDPNGAIVNGASVNVKNTETGFERTVTSNSDGFFSAPLLPLGKYRVTVNTALTSLRKRSRRAGKRRSERRSNIIAQSRNEDRRRRQYRGRFRRRRRHPGKPDGTRDADQRAFGRKPADQPPRFFAFRASDAGRFDRPGSGRRRNYDQRAEGNSKQHLDRRRGREQSVLRRTARRTASGVHDFARIRQRISGRARRRVG